MAKTKTKKKTTKLSKVKNFSNGNESNKLPQWKKVKLSGNLLSDDGGFDLEGLLGLEVLENANSVGVTKEQPAKVKKETFQSKGDTFDDSDSDGERCSKNGRKKKKKVSKKKAEELNSTPGKFVLLRQEISADTKPHEKKKEKGGKPKHDPNENDVNINEHVLSVGDLNGWTGMGIAEPILRVLAEKGFEEPTEIQALTLSAAILGRRDILGAAETGSGKTLAFGIPIINGILQMKQSPGRKLKPYRKLSKKATKIDPQGNEVDEAKISKKQNQFSTKMKSNKRSNEERDNWTPPPEEINNFPDFTIFQPTNHDVVEEENERDSEPLYALILTPTRELAVQVKNHLVTAAKYTDIRIAAIFGGLAAVKQERILSKCPEIVVATPGRLWELITEGNKHLNKLQNINFLVVDETDRMVEKGHFEELQHILERLNTDPVKRVQRQNFIFSATLTLMHELPQYLKLKNGHRKRKLEPQTSEQKIQTLIEYFGISQPKIVDITPKQTTGGTAQRLTECRITCSHEQKDLYLYYFLQMHSGRTIVFCNSIDCVRRLTKLFSILACEPRALHAKMAQRARLKNLERFTNSPTGLLIATDVAARGLDIPNVEHVIHYQVPRTSENYIHRSGRTARGKKDGIAVLFMEPKEVREYVKLCRALNRNEDLPIFPVADRYLAAVRERVSLATQIDVKELQIRRKNADIGWLKKSAKEMDIMIDDESDFSENDLYDSDDGGGAIERSLAQRELERLQQSLKRLISKPIFPKGFSYKYPSTISIDSNASDAVREELGQSTSESSGKAVNIMKKVIEENLIAKKQRNKKPRPL